MHVALPESQGDLPLLVTGLGQCVFCWNTQLWPLTEALEGFTGPKRFFCSLAAAVPSFALCVLICVQTKQIFCPTADAVVS